MTTKHAGFVSRLHLAELSVSPDAVTGRLGAVALVLACLLGSLAPCQLQAQNITLAPVITTVAGNGTYGYSGDNGPATSAELSYPHGVAVDSAGNLYIVDPGNQRIRKVDASGTITTVAGNGIYGYSGDNGPATSAELYYPQGVALDRAGNLYIADDSNQRIRKVDASGIITTVAGNGTGGYSGDNGPATSAELQYPTGVAVDSAGNLFIVDPGNQRIRKVDASGTITTVAGNGTGGYSGDGGPATSAELSYPHGVAVDSAGNLYIADQGNQRIRKVDASGTITTVAGNGTGGYNGDHLAATSAELNGPDGVAVDRAGNLYIADSGNQRIRKVDTGGTISTVAGNGTYGYSGDNGPATSAELNAPSGVAVDSAGNLYIADAGNSRIRKVTNGPVNFGPVNVGANSTQNVFLSINTALTLSTVQTSGDYSVLSDSCALNGTICTLQVQFTPTKPGQRWFPLVVIDSSSNKYSFGLEGTGVGSALAFTPGIIGTVAGNGTYGYSGDNGPATSAELNAPSGVAVDSAGNLYIADVGNSRIRKVDASGTITTVAGNGTQGYNGDNIPATSAELGNPYGVAVDSAGNLYIADTYNGRIRKVDASGTITTVAGNGTQGYNGDNIPATSAELSYPRVAVDSAGNLYIADNGKSRIRKVDASGMITTVAGNGTYGYNGDNISATSAELNAPSGVVVDSAGNLYIADSGNQRIRKVDASGTITTVAGNGTYGYSGDNGPATSAELNAPSGVAVDSAGNLYIADAGNSRIRKVDASGTITTVAGNGTGGYSGDNGPATSAELHLPYGVAVDSAGNLYIADLGNQRIRKVDVTTSALSFSSLNVGQTSGAQSVAVSDVGNAALNFSSLLASSNFLLQGVGNDCVAGTPLAVGATCALGVAFAPTMAGNPLTGALTVSDDAFNNPQSVGLSGTGTQASQIITFGALSNQALGTAPFAVAATASSGLTVSFASTTPAVCTVSVSTVTLVAAGTCTIQATQAGNTNYAAATPVSQSFQVQVTQASQTITFVALANQALDNAPFTVSATASSGLTVSFASTTPAVCTVSGATVTLVGAGTCTIQATQAGNPDYAAATPINQSFQVEQPSQTISFAGGQTVPTSIWNGLVAYYPFDRDSNDYSGFGNSLILNGGASIVADGEFGGALSLGNSASSETDYAIASGDNPNLDFGSSDFTIQEWVNFADVSRIETILEKFTGGNGPGWSLSNIPPIGDLEFYGSSGADKPFSFQAGVWYQILVVDSSGTVTLYVNTAGGGLNSIGSVALGAIPTSTNPLLVGIRDLAAGQPLGFNGLIDDVAIWDRALSTSEISLLNTNPLSSLLQSSFSANTCPGGQTTPAPCSETITLNYNVNADTTFGANPTVLTQGAPNLDFTLSSTTCRGSQTAGSSCTVNVLFAPRAPGLRMGAVQLMDNSGNLLVTTFIHGVGQGPAIAFGPGVQTVVAASGLSDPSCVAVDAAGDVFIGDTRNNRVVEVPAGGGPQTTVGSGLNFPTGVAVDGAGDVFIADYNNQRVVEVPAGGGPQTTVGSGLSYPYGVTVDGAGNVFIADDGNNRVVEVPAGGGPQTTVGNGLNHPYAVVVDGAGDVFIADYSNNRVVEVPAGGGPQTTVGSGLNLPTGVAVDGAGDVFIADPNNNRVVEVPAGGGAQTTVPATGLSGPTGVAVDGAGDVFIADAGNNRVVAVQGSQPPTLSFAATLEGNTSTDSPQSVTVQNIGNQSLAAVPPGLSIGANFMQVAGSGTPADCTNSFSLAPGASCNLSISFIPQTTGSIVSAATFTDNALNATAASQSVTLQGTGTQKVAPTVSFTGAPATAGYNSSFTVSATTNASSVAVITASGACAVTSSTGTSSTITMTSGTGTCSLLANWAADNNYLAASASQSTLATKIAPTVAFTGAPATAPYHGTFAVVATTNASTTPVITASGSCSIAGATVTISAPSGTCSLSATWAADNNYLAASANQSTIATKATPTINWTTPAAITYGTALSSTQLDATATYNGAAVAGTFVYSPVKGTVLTAGSQTLSVNFTATNTADYTSASASVTLQVNRATPKITWAKPAAITYGTALSNPQLDATASVAGTFAYSPAAGTVLGGGTQTLSVAFTPTDTTDYTTATDSVTITVNKAAPILTWATPVAITYGTKLSSAQLDATASVAGSFVYSPAAGAIEGGGSHKLSVTFTPTDTVDYTTATASVALQVNPATPTINWTTPAAITYGTALSGTQLDATATYNGAAVAGTFVYSPVKGTVLTAGSQTLSVNFTPTNTAGYTSVSASVTLQVNRATPKITWAKPAAITYGTALSNPQLDATASVAGTFAYSPAAGTVLGGGTQTLSVAFTPTDTTDYTTATDSVTITVNKGTSMTVITSSAPNPSLVGQAVTVNFSVTGTGVPTGTVTVTASTGQSCNGMLSAGMGSCSLTFTASGSPTLTASYAGDNNFKSSTSAKVTQTVKP